MKHRICQQCAVKIEHAQGRRYCKRCAAERRKATQRQWLARKKAGSGSIKLPRGRGLNLDLPLEDTGMLVDDAKHVLIHPDGKREPVPSDFALNYYFGSVRKNGTMKVYRAAPQNAAA